MKQGVDSGQSQGTFKQEASTYKEARHGVLDMDYCRTNCGVACRAGDERCGHGILVDIILGLLGGLLGGWLFGQLGIWPGGGVVGSIIVAFIGAVILVGITRLIKRA